MPGGAVPRVTDPPKPWWRRGALALGAVLGAGLLLRVAVLVRPIAFLDHVTLIDDTYLSLTIARNLARGLGPLYGLAATNGYQPLWVWLLTPVYRLMPHDPLGPIHVALGMLVLFDLAGLWLLHRLVRRVTGSGAIALMTAALWAVSPYAIQTSLNGLETSLAFCLLCGAADAMAAAWLEPARFTSTARMRGIGVWLGLAALARIDSLLLFPFAALHLLWGAWRAGVPGRDVRRALRIALGAACVIAAVWPLVSWVTTGTWLPVSGQAVRYMVLSNVGHHPDWRSLYGPMLAEAGRVILRKNIVAMALLAGLGVAWAARRRAVDAGAIRAQLAPIAPLIGFSLAIVASYALVVFGHWHFPRYLFPVSLLLAVLTAVLLHAVASSLASAPARRTLLIAITAVALLGHVATPAFGRMFAAQASDWGYLPIGLWARDYFPVGTVIGGSQTGALGYFAERLTVINLDGVVNRACYQAMRAGRASDYVRNAGVRWLVWQDDVAFLSRESRRAQPLVLRDQGEVPRIRTRGEPWRVYEVVDLSRAPR